MKTSASSVGFDYVQLIYNAQAGNRRVSRDLNMIMAHLNLAFPTAQIGVRPTTGPHDATTIAAHISRQWNERALVIIAGGDGSVSETANGLIGTQTPLLVLPYGTGNDFSRAVYRGMSREPQEILAALVTATKLGQPTVSVTAIDAMRTRAPRYRLPDGTRKHQLDRYAINVISMGFDSVIGISADALHRKVPWLLGMSYPLSVLTELTKQRNFELALTWRDGNVTRSESQRYTVCAVANASHYGGGFEPNPQAILNDGVIEVILSRELQLLDIARLIGKFRRGDKLPADYVQEFSGREFRFSALGDSELVLTLDGQGVYTRELQVEVCARALLIARPFRWPTPPALSVQS
ncbi:MAG: diacylglycerol kinase family protein [Actinomycetaceae bacterium]|nr:diacylglycerol kinase family protein [Actinomycetaceae bacterium]